MPLENIIKADGVLCNATARSKKHCLEILSELLIRDNPEISSADIFACLVDRERLGCTGLDRGAAFPHCRMPGIENSKAALIKLSEPIDFDSPDGEPVDLVIGMMVPEILEESHMEEIRIVTQALSDEELRRELRTMNSSNDLYNALIAGAQRSCQTNCA